MTNTNDTLIINIADFRKDCSVHQQFCLSVQRLLENGSKPEDLKNVINEMREQSELIESLSNYLISKHEEERVTV